MGITKEEQIAQWEADREKQRALDNKLFDSVNMDCWDELAAVLELESAEICTENECTEEEHYCGSVAYISVDGELADICIPDMFRGWGSRDMREHGSLACVPLPWEGNGEALKQAVEEDPLWY